MPVFLETFSLPLASNVRQHQVKLDT